MIEGLQVISLSYKKAPLEIREVITLDESEIKDFYLKLRDVFGLQEALVLSTCNRTEIYYKSDQDLGSSLVALLASCKGKSSEEIIGYFEFIKENSLTYLFEVALGLQSQVIGDLQITNQIKQAYQWSADMEMAGPLLHRAMHTVFYANKRIVQETGFRDGAASTSYVTVDLMESFLPMLVNSKILVLGLGEIGEDVLKTLIEKEHQNITLCNRTLEKAEILAKTYNCAVLPFELLNDKIATFDVIVSSVRGNSPLITFDNLNSANRKSIVYLFDLSIPRSIDIQVESLLGVVLYGLDEIQKRSNKAIKKRMQAVPKVKSIIEEMVGEVNNWSKELVVSPTIQKLKNALEQIRKDEMARYVKAMSDEEIEKMDKITSGMMQKIIKLPVLQLKAACQRGEADTLIDVLNDLFNLEKEEVKS